MEKASRGELLKYIDEQQEKLTKYQNKLRDLVAAYKGVLKEKEALEKSLQILSSCKTSSKSSQRVSAPSSEDEGSGIETPVSTESDSKQTEDEEENDAEELREQLVTLTTSLVTLTQEKSKMEANYMAEKKTLRQEYEDRESRYEEDLSQLHNTVDELEKQISTYKSKLRDQQLEREKEETDHGVMLRELQTLLSKERHTREQLETQIDELRFDLEEQKSIPAGVSLKSHDKQVRELQRMIDSLKAELQRHVERDDKPSKELETLQAEMRVLKASQRDALAQERERLTLAQRMLQEVSTQSEQRIAELETKISELSNSVGEYERQRFQDQQAIAKLRERVTQLDLENTALAQAAQAPPPETGREGGDVTELLEKVSALLPRLLMANDRAEKPLPVTQLLFQCGLDEATDLHDRCRLQLDAVKDEFERYKLRAQSVLKNRHSKEANGCREEVEDLQKTVAELKERLWQVRSARDDMEAQHREKEESLSGALAAVQEKHREERAALQAEKELRVAEVNLEMKRHRERTIAILSEKDRELEALRHHRSGEYTGFRVDSTSSEQDLLSGGASSEEAGAATESAVAELLARSSMMPPSGESGTLLHLAQEQARRDVELCALRRQKHGLETALRQQQQSATLRDQRHSEQIALLKEQLRSAERSAARENSADLEYLKNVVYKYILCTEDVGRTQMLNAIATILQFSPKERQAVTDHMNSSRWFAYKAPNKT